MAEAGSKGNNDATTTERRSGAIEYQPLAQGQERDSGRQAFSPLARQPRKQ